MALKPKVANISLFAFQFYLMRRFVMFLSLAQSRRSIRKYQNKPVESEKIDRLVEALLRAPTSMGKNSWEFVVVTDRSLLKELSSAKPHGAAFLKNAALGIVVCGNPQVTDVWIEDASIASIFIHLAATSLELGSCWIQIREHANGGGLYRPDTEPSGSHQGGNHHRHRLSGGKQARASERKSALR